MRIFAVSEIGKFRQFNIVESRKTGIVADVEFDIFLADKDIALHRVERVEIFKVLR